jgi:hypothetical protein
MIYENNTLRKSCVAGMFTVCSDAVWRHIKTPYLAHNIHPIGAGVAGLIISFTAEKCHLYIQSRLSESYQASTLVGLSTRVFSHLIVGGAFGVGAALLIPTAGITAAAGAALGFTSLIGLAIDRKIESIVAAEYYDKNANGYRRPGATLLVNVAITPFYIPFSDALIKYFFNTHSLLGSLLIHNIQNVLISFALGGVVSMGAVIAYAFMANQLGFNYYSSSPLKDFSFWAGCHLFMGALTGISLSMIGAMVGLSPSLGFTFTTGIALGVASIVGPTLIRLACKVLRIFYINNALHRYLRNPEPFVIDPKKVFNTVVEEGKASHQANLFIECLKDRDRYANKIWFVEKLFVDMKENDKIPKMDAEKFKTWTAENSSIWKSITEKKLSPELNSMKATYENFAGIAYGFQKTEAILNLIHDPESYDSLLEYICYYQKIYKYIYSGEQKKDIEFNYKALGKIGNVHWRAMNGSMKTEEFVRQSAFRDDHSLLGVDAHTLRELLPKFIQEKTSDKSFIGQISYHDLLKASLMGSVLEYSPKNRYFVHLENNIKNKILAYLCGLKKYENTYKVPKTIQKKIIGHLMVALIQPPLPLQN